MKKILIAAASLLALAACGGGGVSNSNNGGGTLTLTHSLTEALEVPNSFTATITVASDSQKQVALFWSENSSFDSGEASSNKLYTSTCSGDCLGTETDMTCNATADSLQCAGGTAATITTGTRYLIAVSCNYSNPIAFDGFYEANQAKCSVKSKAFTLTTP